MLVLLFAVALAAVSCAKATTPTFTAGTEKVAIYASGESATSFHGAIDNPFTFDCVGTFVPDMRLAEIHWVTDEYFYSTGYKALLNRTVEVIVAPPDSKRTNFQMPLKYC